MADTVVVDALVIGGGAAGLGAALALCRQNHSVIIFDSGDYRNKVASEMHMVSTWDHRKPHEFRAAARAELVSRYPDQCTFVDRAVRAIKVNTTRMQTTFEARDEAGSRYQGRKVILATGSRDLLPCINGFEECWGRGIVHCLLCHGHEESGSPSAGILAVDVFAEPSTLLRVLRACKQFVSRVCVYTNGNTRVAAQLREATSLVSGCDIEPVVIERLEMVHPSRDGPQTIMKPSIRIVLEAEEEDKEHERAHTHAWLVYHPGTEQASDLPSQLGVELTADGDIKLGAFQETSQPGVFAAGDCSSPHKYFSTASVMGHMAGAGAAQQLQADKRQ
ncbi:hypothetical protein BKA64DRAFT_764962 [Cadophora sp. MPI-SDFR-AT-0126]|nr:hypothetical protein BKA64DRAFT_764962 [Leotiomycetes sp. MPI-SDFR-AT-0126]